MTSEEREQQEHHHLLVCPSCDARITVEQVCEYTKSRAADVKACADKVADENASSTLGYKKLEGKRITDDTHSPWDEAISGSPEYRKEDFMPSEMEYRDILESVSFCPNCQRMNFFDRWWGMNDSDKKKIEELMKWSEWKVRNQYEDKRSLGKRWRDDHPGERKNN